MCLPVLNFPLMRFFFFFSVNNVLDLGSTSDLDYILNHLLSKTNHLVEDLRYVS